MRNVARLSPRGTPRRTVRPPSRVRLQVEQLESRNLLSVYTPAQIRHAYGFDQVAQNGAGQTIAIVDAYHDPNALRDANKFSSTFGLSTLTNGATFRQVNQNGGTSLPRGNAGWAEEISLDVQWAHAIAPGANILLVEARSASLSNLESAVKYASAHASVVSMSWGTNDFSGESSLDSLFQTTGVTYVASSGDTGGVVEWPAVSANVLSVGGTSLYLNSDNSYNSESAWSSGGGGVSGYEPEPSYQAAVNGSGFRSTPDVSYNADPNTGVYVYDSYGVYPGWYAFGGTSAGAPQWAGLVALANQARGSSLTGYSQVLPTLYSLPASDLHDVTTGSNGNIAGPGYDLATGWGTPKAPAVISALAKTAAPASRAVSTPAPTGSSSSGTGLRQVTSTTPVVAGPTGFTAVPVAVAASQTPGPVALFTQPQVSLTTLPGATTLGSLTQASAPALVYVNAPSAQPVWLVGGEDPVVNDAEDMGGAVVPAGPGPVQPGSGEVPPPRPGQGVRPGVEERMEDVSALFEASEEVTFPSEGGLTVESTSALAGLALALGGFWGVPREKTDEQRRARAKPWPKG
jgi:hypothetical protein